MNLTVDQRRKFHGDICAYCSKPPKLYKDSTPVYGKDYGPVWACLPCKAWVGCHPGTIKPLGRLAKKELRLLKHEAHKYFDKIFVYKIKTRHQAYKWLSEKIGTPRKYTHIGMFNEDTCRKVIAACKEFLENHYIQKNEAR